jgi:aryl-alcohol dehydrogenase-like predicted oxidoreductase
MKALVVKSKYIAEYHHQRKKPVVTLQVPKKLLSRTTDEGNEAKQKMHLNQFPMRVVLKP